MKRGMRPDDVFLLRMVTDPRLSPDGTQVAFVVSTSSREQDEAQTAVWTAPVDGNHPAHRFTSGPMDTSPRWSPDGRHLAFLSRRGGKDSPNQIFVAPLDGGDPRPLTEATHGATQPAWSPDGRRVAYVAQTGEWTPPPERSPTEKNAPVVVRHLRYRFDGLGWFDTRRSHIFTVEVDSGATKQVTRGDFNDAQPAWSPDGALIAFTSDRKATRFDRPHPDVWTVAGSGGRAKRVTAGKGTYGAPEFAPDGRWLSYLGTEAAEGDLASNTHLYVVPTDGSAVHHSVSAPLDRPAFGLVWPTGRTHGWAGDSCSVFFLASDRGAQHLFRAGLRAGSTPEVVIGGDRQVIGIDVRGHLVAFSSVWPSLLPEARVVDLHSGAERMLSDVNGELRRTVRLAKVKRLRTKGIESFLIKAPDQPKGRPAPTLVEIHGGPHGSHPQSVFLPLYQCAAAAGYNVLLPNPRGSQSYGEEFAYGCVGDWGGGDFDDIMAAVDAVVDKGIADPDRLYVAGYSYGGFMTGWTIGHTNRFRGACISAPVANLQSMVGTTDMPDFAEFEMGGLAAANRPDVYAKHSPITYLSEVRTPVRLFHWDGDIRCPVGQSEEWFQGLKLLGRDVEMIRYPGGFHIVRSPSQMVDFVRRHLEFFAGCS